MYVGPFKLLFFLSFFWLLKIESVFETLVQRFRKAASFDRYSSLSKFSVYPVTS